MTTEPSVAIAKLQPAALEIRVLGTLEVIAPGGDAVAIKGRKAPHARGRSRPPRRTGHQRRPTDRRGLRR